MKNIFLLFITIFSLNAMADNLEISSEKTEYTLMNIQAENVKGVELTLTSEIEKRDCNKPSMMANLTLIKGGANGDGEGWYDNYIIDAGIFMTQVNCPLPNPEKEVVSSQPFFIKAFNNINIHGGVIISILVPQGFELVVKEIKE